VHLVGFYYKNMTQILSVS